MNPTTNSPGPTLFASVRSSKDVTLAAFGGALLVAFALHAGAFLPKLEAPAIQEGPAIQVARKAAPHALAGNRAIVRQSPAATAEPCPAPRG
ncbi:MAG TPA: hypothetical protein VIW03_11275 [Anaeromyxobacter sp.]